MNRIILILAVISLSFSGYTAKSQANKVPANAAMVVKYSGENFSKSMPLKKIDNYGFIQENLLKKLKVDTLTSLQNTGINFEMDIYQYAVTDDSSLNIVTLFHLKNNEQFLRLVDANYGAEMRPDKKNGYEFLSLSADSYLGWSNDMAVLVISNYKNPDKYYYGYNETRYDSTAVADTVMVDSIVPDTILAPAVPAPEDKIEQTRGEPLKKKKSVKPVAGKKKTVTITKKNAATKNSSPKKKTKAPVEEVAPVEDSVVVDAPKEEYIDSFSIKRDLWYAEKEKQNAAKQKQLSDSIINDQFNVNFVSVEADPSYQKLVDPAAHVSLWMNSTDAVRQLWSSFYNMLFWRPYMYRTSTFYNMENINGNDEDGFRSGMNLYFDKDKMRIEQRSFSPDEKTANLGKEIFNSKQNTELVNYVNPDNIGYLSMSVNSESMMQYYYKLLRQYVKSTWGMKEYADIVDAYIDFLEIMIDEKGLADLLPGNYLFVLHDMQTKQVTYTDYDYDKDFKMKEVKKTKQELSPNFTFVVETRREDFMEKLAKLPLKHAKKEKFTYKDNGTYYEYVFEEGKYPLSSLYFMVNKGKLIITTSKASIDMTLNNTSYNLDAESKKSILSNNYSLKINAKKLFDQISPELSIGANRKIGEYLQNNIGDVKMESSLKNGMMQSVTTMKISGNHANSLEFFFNMIDAINDIMEKDKLEKEQKVN